MWELLPIRGDIYICSEDLLSIFGLNCDENLEFSLAQIFMIWGKYAC